MSTIHVGIIGVGRIGHVHYLNLSQMPNVSIDYMCDLLADDSWADKYPAGGRFVTDYHEILADPAIDAVLICVPTDLHPQVIIDAAEAGKHIFCEKPVGFDNDQILAAYHAVKKAGVYFQTGFNRRQEKNFRRIVEARDAGQLGKPEVLKVTSRDPEPPSYDYVKRSGGLFKDMMIHDFDIVRFISGEEVRTVRAMGASLVDPHVGELGDVDTAIVTLEFASGMLGVIDNSRRAAYGYDQRIELFGSKGVAVCGNNHESETVVATADGVRRDLPLHFFLERYKEAYRLETEKFFDVVANGGEIECTFEDGIKAVRLAEAALESLNNGGAAVEVKPIE
ncbi:inositol 2-dehydrogenase [Bifidobacterium callitrichos]|uniref:Inositol 2-dehydrogenase n=1 Tax=Bifidobacterium callitrichos TaxID=762209 RepID=A0A2T3GD52_9BIFI|nr:inositol 2-dehydrogenase [Bifidobacterium callitrichos]PST47414.1 inositol 2-dehydrogenase [Bifidobacterium callitrichos]